eukprot:308657_1
MDFVSLYSNSHKKKKHKQIVNKISKFDHDSHKVVSGYCRIAEYSLSPNNNIIPTDIVYLCILFFSWSEQFDKKLHGKYITTSINMAKRVKPDYEKQIICESAFGSFVVDYEKHFNCILSWTIKMDEQLQPKCSIGIIAVDESENIYHLLHDDCFSKDTSSKGVKSYYGIHFELNSSQRLDAFDIWSRVISHGYNYNLKQCRNNFIKMKLNLKNKTLSYCINDQKYNTDGIAFKNMEDISKYKYRVCVCISDKDAVFEIIDFSMTHI